MSENQNLGPSIPPEREFAYLQNAEKVANEAAEPVIQGLANLAIAKAELTANEPEDALVYAEELTKDAGRMSEAAGTIGDQAEAFAHTNDYAVAGESAKRLAAIGNKDNAAAYQEIADNTPQEDRPHVNTRLTKNERAFLEAKPPKPNRPESYKPGIA